MEGNNSHNIEAYINFQHLCDHFDEYGISVKKPDASDSEEEALIALKIKVVEKVLSCEEGATADNFDPQPAVARWSAKCATQRRPYVKPSGSHASHSAAKKRKLPESEVVEAVKDLLDDNTDIVALE